MEQVQKTNSETKRTGRGKLFYIGLLIVFFIVAGVAAYFTYNSVRDFVAAWNITDLPGIVVNPGAEPTEDSPGSIPIIDNPPALTIGPEPIPWDVPAG